MVQISAVTRKHDGRTPVPTGFCQSVPGSRRHPRILEFRGVLELLPEFDERLRGADPATSLFEARPPTDRRACQRRNGVHRMKSLPVSRARIGEGFESVVVSGQPIRLTSHNSSAVIVAEEQWRALEETLYRLSTPSLGGARASAGRREKTRTEGGAHVRG